ncbi:MAG: hypothetical protein V2J89_00010 [Halieaceae bacterium]|jgi:hypothetical protein|nr:hypothetical protein [Halieaceae bacterium]
MKAVARYVMKGRNQALWVSVLGASTLMFSWLSAAVLALVTLRKGPTEGGYLLAWAVLPAGFLLGVFGDAGPLGMILGTTALAVLLRWTVSLPLTLAASAAIGLLTGAALLAFGDNYLQTLEQYFAELFKNLQSQLAQPEGREITLVAPGVTSIAGLLGLMNALSCTLCLLLARWWQAALYNPGGFRAEFHGLRFDTGSSVVLALLVVGISSLGLEYRPWAAMFALPLSLAGLGLIHARAAHRKQGVAYITLLYLLWVTLDAVKLIVIGLAVADSWIDFRRRWRKPDDKTDSDNE